jgi:adenylate cyclase
MTGIFQRASGLTHELTGSEAAVAADLDPDIATQVWRAFGLPEIDQNSVKAYDEQDVETLRALGTLLAAGIALPDLLAVARVYGQAFSRIAEAEERVYRRHILDPILEADDPVAELEEREGVSALMVSLLEAPIRNAHRRQLDIAIRQLVVSAAGATAEPTAVGFVDLVGYSTLTMQIESADLTKLISRFGDLAFRCCRDAGARVVKSVGDAVLLVSPRADVALEAAWRVVDEVASDSLLPAARAGLDFGPVVPLEGDYFGNPVNVAARLIAVAKPASVVSSRSFADALVDRAAVVGELGGFDLKGVGQVEVVSLTRWGQPSGTIEPR